MQLREIGWDEGFSHHFDEWAGKPHMQPGRVVLAFN
jgi:hypothetical protein